VADLIRRKAPGSAWETEADTGGGPPGTGNLDDVLSNGNDAGGQQIVNLANGSADTDAATVGQVNGAYTQNLNDILTNGNNAGNFQVKNVADGTDPQDAVTVAQLEAAATPGLDAVLAVNGNANGHDIQSVADMQAATINVTGGDDSGPVAKIVPPANAVNSVAEIGPQNLGLIVGPDGSVQNRADDGEAASLVAMQRGSVAVYIDTDGTHMVGLPITDPHVVGVLWQDVDVVKVSLGP
jgi:hypothetical protein